MYGGSSVDLIRNVKRPLFLLPAGNDPANVKEGGELTNLLLANQPNSRVSGDFEDMAHGWTVRGDTADEAIRVKNELAYSQIYDFFSKNL